MADRTKGEISYEFIWGPKGFRENPPFSLEANTWESGALSRGKV